MRVGVTGIGLCGAGLAGWNSSLAVLAGDAPFVPQTFTVPAPTLLSPTERRRTGPVTRLALAVAQEASAMSGLDPASLRSVFASSNGDGLVVGAILDALSRPDGFVSPTQFHNSVHNAAAGYWSIGAASPQPATVLGCHDWSFAAGLLKAASEAVVERAPVLLVVYDVPLLPPMAGKRPMASPFGVALVLTPDPTGGPTLEVAFGCEPSGDSRPDTADLAALANGNPAARSLCLLQALTRSTTRDLTLSYLDGHLAIRVNPSPSPSPARGKGLQERRCSWSDIAALVPHAGAMCLLSRIVSWSAERINCAAESHLDPANPLRRNGRLSIGCAVEYATQAAAAHGVLRDGAARKPGYLAALRGVTFHVGRLDDPAHGILDVEARLEHATSTGLMYGFSVRSEAGAVLAQGRATVALPG